MRVLPRAGFVTIFAVLLAAGSQAHAQTYTDVTMDYSYVYLDVYDDAPYYGTSCPEYTDVSIDWAGGTGDAQAYYPNTAHVSMSAVNTPDTSYPGTKEVIHYGQQRGGNCGPFTDTLLAINIRLATVYYGPLRAASGGFCSYNNTACSGGTPSCPAPHVTAFSYPSCSNYVRSSYLIVNGRCSTSIDFAAAGPGPCS
jgi:hypothetical protein